MDTSGPARSTTGRPALDPRLLRRALLVGRAVVALLILAAIVGQLITSLTFWTQRGDADIPLNVVNFFAFFTIESNILAMVVLALLVAAQLGRPKVGRRFDVLLLCASTYMVVTGIVYNTLLRGIELPQGATLGWSNEVLHLVAPLWMLIDWLVSPRLRDLRWRDLWIVAVYPLAWLAVTLLRGPITPDQAAGDGSWYPYPFLDPANFGNGYAGVTVMCLVVAVTVLVGAALLLAHARWRARSRD
ncbi:Pr6Pr family membrane protein [Agrococcus baldri]|uniref:Pr6Pr family membrane protein n=1 Tax=Agrococcus baldri TaxID=153730 RepID=A0AA87RFF3_9MICO|nr:Pr6Pr family membrane protein [Agrococcus baldri]GEK81682.1 hypothetical protein ABA31_30330 [Agrococcus baldri]